MSRYTVVWHDEAQDQLANIWMAASDRQSVTIAANAIDRHLAVDPGSKGVEVEIGIRQLVVPPLRVLFRVSPPDLVVQVADAVLVE